MFMSPSKTGRLVSFSFRFIANGYSYLVIPSKSLIFVFRHSFSFDKAKLSTQSGLDEVYRLSLTSQNSQGRLICERSYVSKTLTLQTLRGCYSFIPLFFKLKNWSRLSINKKLGWKFHLVNNWSQWHYPLWALIIHGLNVCPKWITL